MKESGPRKLHMVNSIHMIFWKRQTTKDKSQSSGCSKLGGEELTTSDIWGLMKYSLSWLWQ